MYIEVEESIVSEECILFAYISLKNIMINYKNEEDPIIPNISFFFKLIKCDLVPNKPERENNCVKINVTC